MLNSGTLLSSRYRIQTVLGRGGMGAVYLAQVEALDKKVAVKEMELRGLTQGELSQAVRQFQKEAAFLANLEHPNLVPVTDYFRVENKHYLVMAYVEGQTLQEMLVKRGRPYNWPDIRDWTYRLIEVLSFLHSRNPPILFRDLKPSNIMIANTGRLHLIDFGIARTARVGDRTSTFLQGTGTKGFSPIEQYGEGHSTDQRSDIYSLGATLYYLLTGKVPPDAVERVSLQRELVPPSHYNPSLPTWLDQLIVKAMAVAPPERYQSVQEMGAALRRLDSFEDDIVDFSQAGSPNSVEDARQTTAYPTPSIKLTMYDSHHEAGKRLRVHRWLSSALTVMALSLGLLAFQSMGVEPEPSFQPLPPTPLVSATQKEVEKTVPSAVAAVEEQQEPEVRLGGYFESSPVSGVVSEKMETTPVDQSSKDSLSEAGTGTPHFSLGGTSYPKARSSRRPTSSKAVVESEPEPEADKVAKSAPNDPPEVKMGARPQAPPVLPEENLPIGGPVSEAAAQPMTTPPAATPPPPPPSSSASGGQYPNSGFGVSSGAPMGGPLGGPVGGGGRPGGGR